MSQFGGSRFANLCIQLAMIGCYAYRVSHSEIPGQRFFPAHRGLSQVTRLHRLLMPRHPPVALNSLTKKNLIQACSWYL